VFRNENVRVLSSSGARSEVDIDDDGLSDGYILTSDLTPDFTKMPPW